MCIILCMQDENASILVNLANTIKKLDWYYNNYNFTLYNCDLLPVFYSSFNLLEDIAVCDMKKCIDDIKNFHIETNIEDAIKSLEYNIYEINNMLNLVKDLHKQIEQLKCL